MTTAIWWIRRDLRLTDNQALSQALAQADAVIPLFILDPKLWNSTYVGAKRLAFLLAGLRQLEADLHARGSRLVIRQGDPSTELRAVLAESGAVAIFAEADVSPYARRRDTAVAATLPLRLAGGLTVQPPDAVLKAGSTPYTVFTPFSRAWKALPPPTPESILPPPSLIATPAHLPSRPLPAEPDLPAGVPFEPGEAAAQRRLAAFVAGADPAVYRYDDERNRLDLDGTSGLSPYLRFGLLSPRQAAAAAWRAIEQAPNPTARKGADTWLNELIWREFYLNILHHFPQVRGASFRPEYDRMAWRNDERDFSAWCQGRTGYPVVDAAMRQLVASGWMHNRARMIVASFLVKDLLIDWRWGERWFMQHLVDGDPAANNGGWQWTAGVGTDAAPYFRIFNPVLQSQKFDPAGAYIRRWLPELAGVPAKYIHAPWQMPAALQRQANCLIDRDYPVPIVDHTQARQRTLAAYSTVRG
jgi:deoxyribodipyrimidine photo-lyase